LAFGRTQNDPTDFKSVVRVILHYIEISNERPRRVYLGGANDSSLRGVHSGSIIASTEASSVGGWENRVAARKFEQVAVQRAHHAER
jgi:hypothetical protein